MRTILVFCLAALLVLTATGCPSREELQARVAQAEAIHAARVAKCGTGELGTEICARLDKAWEYLQAIYRVLGAVDSTRREIKAALNDLEAQIDAEVDALADESPGS